MGIIPFNFLDVEPKQSFPLYPSGDYILEIMKVEQCVARDNQVVHLKLFTQIVVGPQTSKEFTGCKLELAYTLSSASYMFLQKLFTACGFTREELLCQGRHLNPKWLVGRKYITTLHRDKDFMVTSAERPLGSLLPEKSLDVDPKVLKKRILKDRIKITLSRLKAAYKQFLTVLREG